MESFYHGKPLENIGIVKQMGVFNPLKLGTLCTNVPYLRRLPTWSHSSVGDTEMNLADGKYGAN